eukprot:GFYU01004883.1.p1 GENE.GFYU01004883.1~~GFYU01004883.1.p1  ORF type:complete len:539 (-),score=188.17 GFYU01004883.1:106-1722(-)
MKTLSLACVFVLLGIALLVQLPSATAVDSFKAYRLLQYNKDGEPMGSRSAPVSLSGSRSTSADDTSRRLVVLTMDDVSVEVLESVLSQPKIGGLMIVLPEDMDKVSDDTIAQWREYEEWMLSRSIAIPVYFAPFANAADIYKGLASTTGQSGLLADGYTFTATAGEATAEKSKRLSNFSGWLAGVTKKAQENEEQPQLPTLVITASYDAFAGSAGLATGSSNGVVALLEVARLYSRLYSASRSRGAYNLMFLLTGAGKHNYAGTKHWLETAEPSVLDNLEFALCLDGFLSGKSLNLHISKPAKDDKTTQLYAELEATAKQMGIPFSLKHKKINLASTFVPWPHEQFARKKVVAATLSSHDAAPTSVFSQSSIFEKSTTDVDTLERNIRFVAESLARHVYGYHGQELKVFEGSLGISSTFLKAWTNALEATPRMAPYHISGDIFENMYNVFREFTAEAAQDNFLLDSAQSGMEFFSSIDTDMTVAVVKPVMFDAVLGLANAIYLFFLYFCLAGLPSFSDITGFFSSSKKGKGKKAWERE